MNVHGLAQPTGDHTELPRARARHFTRAQAGPCHQRRPLSLRMDSTACAYLERRDFAAPPACVPRRLTTGPRSRVQAARPPPRLLPSGSGPSRGGQSLMTCPFFFTFALASCLFCPCRRRARRPPLVDLVALVDQPGDLARELAERLVVVLVRQLVLRRFECERVEELRLVVRSLFKTFNSPLACGF